MPNPALHARLVTIAKIAVMKKFHSSLLDDEAEGIADALLASEEWEAREAVVKAATREHEHCDGVGVDLDEEDSAPCAMCHYLARLAAVRGTT